MIGYAVNTSILPDLGREVRDARRETFGHTVIYKSAQASQRYIYSKERTYPEGWSTSQRGLLWMRIRGAGPVVPGGRRVNPSTVVVGHILS
jgi:hypothetical protein